MTPWAPVSCLEVPLVSGLWLISAICVSRPGRSSRSCPGQSGCFTLFILCSLIIQGEVGITSGPKLPVPLRCRGFKTTKKARRPGAAGCDKDLRCAWMALHFDEIATLKMPQPPIASVLRQYSVCGQAHGFCGRNRR